MRVVGFHFLCCQRSAGTGDDSVSAEAEGGADSQGGGAEGSFEKDRDTHYGRDPDHAQCGGGHPDFCEREAGDGASAFPDGRLWTHWLSG